MQETLPQPPPPLPDKLTPDKFRQIIAGLINPEAKPMDPGSSDEYKVMAQELCIHVATHFNRNSLDTMTLWKRITSGFIKACASVPDGDMAVFMGIMMDHVQSLPWIVAVDMEYCRWLLVLTEKSAAWRQGFVAWIARNRIEFTIILGRVEWEKQRPEREASYKKWLAEIPEEADAGELEVDANAN